MSVLAFISSFLPFAGFLPVEETKSHPRNVSYNKPFNLSYLAVFSILLVSMILLVFLIFKKTYLKPACVLRFKKRRLLGCLVFSFNSAFYVENLQQELSILFRVDEDFSVSNCSQTELATKRNTLEYADYRLFPFLTSLHIKSYCTCSCCSPVVCS